MKTRIVMTLMTIRARKVQPCKKTARAPRAVATINKPIYQLVLWFLVIYSSASQETGDN